MSVLIPCSSCRRHVRRTEAACPFCAAELPGAEPAPAARAAAPPGAKRAALFAMGVTLAASACEPENSVPVYGAPWVPEAGSSGAGGSGGNGGSAGAGGRNGNTGGTEATDAAPPADTPDADAPDADAPDAAEGDAAP
jgi:hypothetical protein